ncbi:MAG: nitrous oxide reductase accessory protein NosL [Bacteroidota bacterium]|nr:nitrous oxide reductase accessory protein NosL [Bacteroidota bacterium]
MNKMSFPSRIIIAIVSLSLITTYFLPVWFIFLIAPQYPEGLTMNIWLYKITGQVDIINGLNHYIGMKYIKTEMFPEFSYLIYIVAFFILFGLVVAITGKRKLLFAYLILTLLGGAAAMYDFYAWGYEYGHNLDPKAAIQVPGLYYQPPLIGHKTLLNFDAYSYPDVGGWIIIGVGATFFLVWVYEWYKTRKAKSTITSFNKKIISAAASILVLLFTSCNTKPQPFAYGKDICDDCKMTIMDPKFGGEIITKKGKIYKFDDAYCLANFMKKGNVKEADIAQTVFIDYSNDKNFLDAKSQFFVVSPQLKSPMNSNAASFSNKDAAEQKAKETNGIVKNWDQLYQSL